MKLNEFIDKLKDVEIKSDMFNPDISFIVDDKEYSEIFIEKHGDKMRIYMDEGIGWFA